MSDDKAPIAHPIILPPYLEAEYAERATISGRTVPEEIVRDLEELAESRRYYANVREKVHP